MGVVIPHYLIDNLNISHIDLKHVQIVIHVEELLSGRVIT